MSKKGRERDLTLGQQGHDHGASDAVEDIEPLVPVVEVSLGVNHRHSQSQDNPTRILGSGDHPQLSLHPHWGGVSHLQYLVDFPGNAELFEILSKWVEGSEESHVGACPLWFLQDEGYGLVFQLLLLFLMYRAMSTSPFAPSLIRPCIIDS